MIEVVLAEILTEENKALDKQEIQEEIKEALDNNRFKFIEKDGNQIGFLTWLEVDRAGRQYIYLNNLWIDKEYRKEPNLFFLRRFFREKYPEAAYFYWHRDNRNRYYRIK